MDYITQLYQRSSYALPFFFGLLLLLPVMARAQGEATTYRSVPTDGVITLTDYGFRDWGPALVHYTLDTAKFKPGKLELLNTDGQAVPFQISKNAAGKSILAFVASLKSGQTVTYQLQVAKKDRSAENSTITYTAKGNAVEIGNRFFTLALPKAEKRAFRSPLPVETVPTPILRWKQQGFDWVGGAHFFTERQIIGYETACVEKGPASVTYRTRYSFAPKGEYVWQVQVSDGIPVALVTEEFDFGEVTEGHDFLMLGFGEGWQPEQIGFLTGENQGVVNKLEPLTAYLEQKRKDQANAVKNVSSFTAPSPFMPGRDLLFLDKINTTGAWGPKGGLDLRRSAQVDGKALTSSISVVPYFGGSWRRTMTLQAWYDPNHGVQLALPIGVRLARWYLDLADDQSPFCSHEHDPELPATYGRRVWALGFGGENPDEKYTITTSNSKVNLDRLVGQRITMGYIGLDRYKEWIVDWPEDPQKAKYPCAFFTPEIVARLKKTLDQHPEKALLEQLYLFNVNPAAAENSAKTVMGGMLYRYVDGWQVFGLSAYITTYQISGYMIYADDALACPDLPAEMRKKLRTFLALHAYLYSEPDYNPRGAGIHLGNPNMPIGRTEALALAAPFLPDHPQFKYWMTQLKNYTAFKLASMTEPGGAWFEPPTYQMYGPTRALTLAQIAIRNAGFGDLAKEGWHARCLEYDANLTMPDVRYKGWRILPGMGNSGNTLEAVFGMGAGVLEAADRDEAGFLRFIHRLNSGNQRVGREEKPDYSFTYLPDIPEKPRPLKTTFIPGYGVSFRVHFGSPDETAMLFRAGYNKSHWDMDDLNTIFYGKGAPLSPGTGYQYYYGPASANDAIYHNRVKVGRLDAHEPFGRVEDVIQDYGFGDSADYAMGREYYPPEYFTDGKGEMEWRRHILFLKSAKPEGANYFVMRDTFPGGEGRQTWWHWLNLDGPEMISKQGNIVEMKTKYGAGTTFWFAGGEAMTGKAVITFDYGFGPNYHHLTFGKSLGVPGAGDKETKTIYQLTGKPGADYFYVVYPHKDNEPVAAVTRLSDGCLKVSTPESIDYNFVSDTPLNFDQEGVTFTGKAGSVRVFADRVVFCMNSGAGRIGYKGYILDGFGPYERSVKLADLTPDVVKIDGGYKKEIVSVTIGNGITVTGEAPFEAKLDGETIRIHTAGRARVLVVTRPSFILMPQLTVDGREWMAGWTDYAGSDWGKYKNTNLMAISTLDGDHDLAIRNRVYEPVWAREFTPMVK